MNNQELLKKVIECKLINEIETQDLNERFDTHEEQLKLILDDIMTSIYVDYDVIYPKFLLKYIKEVAVNYDSEEMQKNLQKLHFVDDYEYISLLSNNKTNKKLLTDTLFERYCFGLFKRHKTFYNLTIKQYQMYGKKLLNAKSKKEFDEIKNEFEKFGNQ